MKLKAVAFDIDDTLYPDSSLYFVSLPFLWRYWPLIRVYSKVRKQLRVMNYLAPKDPDGFFDIEAQVFKDISGSDEDLVEIKKKIRDFYENWLNIFQKVKPFPKMKETLFSIRRKGYKLGFMSDLRIANRLEVLGLSGITDIAFSSQETGYLKPNKSPFERLIKEFECAPQEILYVGNSYHYDILGARACGLRTAHITRKAIENSLADLTFIRYEDLEAYIDNIQ